MTVNDRLDEIETRANGATPGPWTVEQWEDFHGKEISYTIPDASRFKGHLLNGIEMGEDEATAEFIAAARQDVPALVAALRAVLTLVEEIDPAHPTARWPITPSVIRRRLNAAIEENL